MSGHRVPPDRRAEHGHFPELTEHDRQRSFRAEDERWSPPKQVRDWLVLGGLILLTVGWTLLVYVLEPGLR